MSARNFGDRVNSDAAKDPAAASAEEVILGLLLLYPEHRAACAAGKIPLDGADFFTDFARRAFTAIIEAQQSEQGYSFSMLGEKFSPDEMADL